MKDLRLELISINNRLKAVIDTKVKNIAAKEKLKSKAGEAFIVGKDSPQAQVPVAFGLSMVKPCFSIESAKSMAAPAR